MKLVNKANKIAFWYAGLSVIIGPAIAILNSYRAPTGAFGDCPDGAWGSTSLSAQVALINKIDASVRREALAMIAIGAIVLILLFAKVYKSGKLRGQVLPLVLVLAMIAGYALLVYAMSGPSGCTSGG